MKGNYKWNKLNQWERQKQYKQHIQRIKLASSPLHKNRSKEQLKKGLSSVQDMINYRKHHKIQQQRQLDLQNHRLLKRLSQIGKRKSKFALITKEQQNYYTINMKSREANRKIKFDQIQQENDIIVERIIKMRNAKGLAHEMNFQSPQKKKSLKKSRASRRNISVMLPRIQTMSEDVEHSLN